MAGLTGRMRPVGVPLRRGHGPPQAEQTPGLRRKAA
jgi:hypothetical protein